MQPNNFCLNSTLKSILHSFPVKSEALELELQQFLNDLQFVWLPPSANAKAFKDESDKIGILAAFLDLPQSPLCLSLNSSFSASFASPTEQIANLDSFPFVLSIICQLFSSQEHSLKLFQMPKFREYDCGMVPNGRFSCIPPSEFIRGITGAVKLFSRYCDTPSLPSILPFEHVLASIGSYTWSEHFLLRGNSKAAALLYRYYDEQMEFPEAYSSEEDSHIYNDAFFKVVFQDDSVIDELFECLQSAPNSLDLLINSPNQLTEGAFKEAFFIFISTTSQPNAWSKNERICLLLALAHQSIPTEMLRKFVQRLNQDSLDNDSNHNAIASTSSGTEQGSRTNFQTMLHLFRHLIHPLTLPNLTDSRYFGHAAYLAVCGRMINEFFGIFEGEDAQQVAKRVIWHLWRVKQAEGVWEFVGGQAQREKYTG